MFFARSIYPLDAKLALERRLRWPDGAKLALDRRHGYPDGAKLALERRFVALERRLGARTPKAS